METRYGQLLREQLILKAKILDLLENYLLIQHNIVAKQDEQVIGISRPFETSVAERK